MDSLACASSVYFSAPAPSKSFTALPRTEALLKELQPTFRTSMSAVETIVGNKRFLPLFIFPNSPLRGNFTFADAMAGFLHCVGLPFVDILSEHRVAAVFEKHGGLFGRTYTTSIVLWAFLSQVLRDGKEASCQSAVARISSHGLGDVDPDTRDYCRARAKLPEEALHELSTEIANEAERLVEPKHLWKGRHAKDHRNNNWRDLNVG